MGGPESVHSRGNPAVVPRARCFAGRTAVPPRRLSGMTTAATLLATCDDELLDDVLRLAAAAGSALEVAHDADTALRGWGSAPIVLIGADEAARLGARRPPRREGVHVVGRGPLPDRIFRDAVAVGARDVLELPAADGWLVELLADAAEGAAGSAAPTVGVVGGSGGAGASTFAAALALVAGASRSAVLVDLDPWGPGLDRVVGVDELPGARWDALGEGGGRLGSRSLRAALPGRDGVAVLSWGSVREGPMQLPSVGVVVEVLSAAQRGSDLVVVDLPRAVDGVAAEVASRCASVVLVCQGTLGSVLAAGKVAARLRDLQDRPGVVVRGGGTIPADQVAAALRLPLLADYPSRSTLAEQVELGLGPVHGRRSPLSRAARDVLQQIAPPGGAGRPALPSRSGAAG